MGLLVICGDLYNAAGRGTITVSPAADPLFLSPKIIDGYIDEFWSQGSLLANSYVRADLNVNPYSGFEATPFSTGYVKTELTGGTVTLETGIKKAGAQSARLATSGSGGTYAGIERQERWRSGQKVRGSVSLYLGGAGPVKLEIRNLTTGNYLHPSGTWQAAQVDYLTTAGSGAWEDKTFFFTVESWSACQGNVANVYCRAYMNTTSGTGYVDEMCWWSEVNTAVLVSHNVDPITPVEWRSSTDNFGASDVLVSVVPPRQGVMYYYHAAGITTRYVQLKFTGTPVNKIRACEVVWGYALSTNETPSWGYGVTRSLAQIRTSRQSIRGADRTADAVELKFSPAFSTQWAEIETEIFERCSGGQTIIVIPDTNRTPIFIGRTPIDWIYTPVSLAISETALRVEPLRTGIWVP